MISQLTSNIVLNLGSPIEEGVIIESIGVSTRDSSVNEEFDNRNELTHKISRQSKKIKKEGISYKELRDMPQSPVVKADAWTSSEDALVLELVAEHGPEWTLIASKMNGKTRKQICDRYLNTLKPNINHGEWTREEEVLLTYLQKQFGTQWCKIAACLPFRTENQVKEKLAGEKSGSTSPNKKESAKTKRDITLVMKQNQACEGPKKAFQEIPDRFRPITFEQRADRFLQYTEDPILRNFDPIFKDNFRDLDWTLI